MSNLRKTQECLQSWIMANGQPPPANMRDAEGLAVYHHAYRARLLEALGETFEKTWSWLGDDEFEEVITDFISTHNPVHWSLSHFGDALPLWIKSRFPDDPEIGELAALEWLLHRCFSGQDAVPMDAHCLANLDWEEVTFTLVPTYAELEVKTNAAAIWRALADDAEPPQATLLPAPVRLRIWRQEYSPHFVAMEPFEARALCLIQQGQSFGKVCVNLSSQYPCEGTTHKIGALLHQWLQDGLIQSID